MIFVFVGSFLHDFLKILDIFCKEKYLRDISKTMREDKQERYKCKVLLSLYPYDL